MRLAFFHRLLLWTGIAINFTLLVAESKQKAYRNPTIKLKILFALSRLEMMATGNFNNTVKPGFHITVGDLNREQLFTYGNMFSPTSPTSVMHRR